MKRGSQQMMNYLTKLIRHADGSQKSRVKQGNKHFGFCFPISSVPEVYTTLDPLILFQGPIFPHIFMLQEMKKMLRGGGNG